MQYSNERTSAYWSRFDADRMACEAWDKALLGEKRAFAIGPVTPTHAAAVQAAMLGYYLSFTGTTATTGAGPGAMDLISFGAWLAHLDNPEMSPAPAGISWIAEGQIPTTWTPANRTARSHDLSIRQNTLGRNIVALHGVPDGGDGTLYELIDHIVQVTRGARPENYLMTAMLGSLGLGVRKARDLLVDLDRLYLNGERTGSFRPGARHTVSVVGNAREAADLQRHWELVAGELKRNGAAFCVSTPEPLTDEETEYMLECLEERLEDAGLMTTTSIHVTETKHRSMVQVRTSKVPPIVERAVLGSIAEALMSPDIEHNIELQPLPSEGFVASRLRNGMSVEPPGGNVNATNMTLLKTALRAYARTFGPTSASRAASL